MFHFSSITEQTRRESYENLDTATINSRIIDILRGGLPMTAREVAEQMCQKRYIPYPVRQAVAPRLTELEDEGIVEVYGKVKDEKTGRTVATYRLVGE